MTAPPQHGRHVLTVNAGSSSLRLADYVLDTEPSCVADTHLSPPPARDPDVLADFVRRHALGVPTLVMHRVVHGGLHLQAPCWIDADVESEIDRLRVLAPLHNGVALDWIRAAREAFGPEIRQAACFDTGFYAELPPAAVHYAVPREWSEKHQLRRYGFHGLAHQSMLDQWRARSHRDRDCRVISLQLGAGCSMTATDHGWPVETSMGFSPLEGLMMATRCGDLDPAAILYLIDEAGFSPAELGWMLNESSGLRGVSGQSGDMQALLENETGDAALAVAMFCHRVRKYLGAYLAVLGGADAILFGGGIGEHAAVIRARVLDHFDWAGIRLDAARNDTVSPEIGGALHAEDSAVEIWVVPTDEARVMAEAARGLLAADLQFATPSPVELSQ